MAAAGSVAWKTCRRHGSGLTECKAGENDAQSKLVVKLAQPGFKITRRGKLTYYSSAADPAPVLSALVTEAMPDGDLKIYLSGLTGGYSAKGILNTETLVSSDPEQEIPLVFKCWERWLQMAGLVDSLSEVDFLEVHAFGAQPKTPSPITDPEGYRAEQKRLREAYSKAYSRFFAEQLPDHGVPARFTVHVVDFPDEAASYEFYSVAVLQRGLRGHENIQASKL